jgi:hypothetical protein
MPAIALTLSHCEPCVLGKSKLPPLPKGKTQRPAHIRKVDKIYIDFAGYFPEGLLYHNYHYLLGGVTDLAHALGLHLADIKDGLVEG